MNNRPNTVIEVVEVHDAREFLDLTSPIAERWHKGAAPKWIFRGQGDENWHLVPRALRREGWSHHFKEFNKLGEWPWNADNQAFAEFLILKEFVEEADRNGFQLPEDGVSFRKFWLDHQSDKIEPTWKFPSKWPNQIHYPVLALAQHYGLPTRLLDWTGYSWAAAYFAARQALDANGAGKLAFWGFNQEYGHTEDDIEVIKVPTGLNANLAAQEGLHTLVREKNGRGQPSSLEGLDQIVKGVFQVPLVKIILPTSEAPALLRLLSHHKVNAATLFPGLGGVIAHMEERCRWDSYTMQQAFQIEKSGKEL